MRPPYRFSLYSVLLSVPVAGCWQEQGSQSWLAHHRAEGAGEVGSGAGARQVCVCVRGGDRGLCFCSSACCSCLQCAAVICKRGLRSAEAAIVYKLRQSVAALRTDRLIMWGGCEWVPQNRCPPLLAPAAPCHGVIINCKCCWRLPGTDVCVEQHKRSKQWRSDTAYTAVSDRWLIQASRPESTTSVTSTACGSTGGTRCTNSSSRSSIRQKKCSRQGVLCGLCMRSLQFWGRSMRKR